MGDAPPMPDDPCARLSPDECCTWDEEYEYAIQSNRPRATAISLFAAELGLPFRDVRCTRGYLRILSRQESWEHYGLDEAEQEWIDNHEPPLTLWTDGKWHLPDGAVCELPESVGVVPADWTPGENDPAWAFCEKDHPDAVPCWRLEER